MKRIVLLKLGGSLITDKTKPYTARIDMIKNVSDQIRTALDRDPNLQMVIVNGTGSYAHYPAVKFGMKDGIRTENQKMGYCKVQDGAARLNRIVVGQLIRAKVQVVSIHPSSIIFSSNGNIKHIFLHSLYGFLTLRMIPVLYGDIVFDEVLGSKIYSSEQLLSHVAFDLLKRRSTAIRIIHCGSVEGVLDSQKKTIKLVTRRNFSTIRGQIQKAKGYDVTGGMIHKIEESLKLSDFGITSLIMDGTGKKNLLTQAILGESIPGTFIR